MTIVGYFQEKAPTKNWKASTNLIEGLAAYKAMLTIYLPLKRISVRKDTSPHCSSQKS